MRSIVRATGIAVAGFVALTGAAFTGTSLAGESDAAPITTDYRDHAVALTASADFDLNPVDAAAPAGEFAAPVVQHAVATVDTASGLFPQPNNGHRRGAGSGHRQAAERAGRGTCQLRRG